jgi:iron complex outermembrane receptor protein
VAASSFGPQSSRPVIRGLDGDRIRLLDNGGASADASSLSFDHAVAVDPLVVERLEVLRGPAALLYGGNATGGVVNAIDNRIPRSPLRGLGGRAELRLGGAAGETAGAALLEAGAGGLNWHADVARRLSGDLRTPGFTRPGDTAPSHRVANSDGDSTSAAVGASWADAQGHAGAAVDGYRNSYGVTVDPAVRIRMRRDRLQPGRRAARPGRSVQQRGGAGQPHPLPAPGGGGRRRGRHHLQSTGQELRVQANQAPLTLAGGTLRGVLGLQTEALDFSALGEEAFVPGTRTRSQALFTLQELALGAATLQAGVRLEQVKVHSDGDAADATELKFGPALSRSFSPRSLSLGLLAPLGSGGWRASASVGSTQRAPAYYELFANGVHVATGAFEQGDPLLGIERSTHAELGAQWQRGTSQVKAQVFATRFARYIALEATGNDIDIVNDEGDTETFPEYAFRAVAARLWGFELEGRTRVAELPWALDLTGALSGRQPLAHPVASPSRR